MDSVKKRLGQCTSQQANEIPIRMLKLSRQFYYATTLFHEPDQQCKAPDA
jgi:hypothetical protein